MLPFVPLVDRDVWTSIGDDQEERQGQREGQVEQPGDEQPPKRGRFKVHAHPSESAGL
jgi:hypothetical protein